MDTNLIKKIRQTLQSVDAKAPIKITGDNMLLFDESKQFIKWDDDTESFYAIQLNKNPLEQGTMPVILTCTGYDIIQYFHINMNMTNIHPVLKAFGFTDQQIENAINTFMPGEELFIRDGAKDVVEAKIQMLHEQEEKREKGIKEQEEKLRQVGLNSTVDKMYGNINPNPINPYKK